MGKKSFVLVLVILMISIGCDYKKGLLPPKTVPISADACDSIKYNNAIKAVLDNNCVSCHGGPFPSVGVDLSTYSGAKTKALDGRMKDRITNANNPMPPSGLMPQSRVDSIICWINKGAPL